MATPTPLGGVPWQTAEFATVVPTGWTNRIDDSAEVERFGGGGTVLYLVEQAPPITLQPAAAEAVADVNVVLLSTPVPDDQLPLYLQSVTSSGATNLNTPMPYTLGGSGGEIITYDRDIQGVPGESRELMVNHRGETFDIVLNAAQATFPAQLAGLQAVLMAWRWTH